jgi:hypothetical protein
MSDVFVDIRLKIHVPGGKAGVVVNNDLEDALSIGDAVCSEIRELKHFPDVYGVELIKIGKVNKIDISVADDFLISDD